MSLAIRRTARVLWLVLFLACSAGAQQALPANTLQQIQTYISSGWDTLTRSMSSCTSMADPKLSGDPVLYLPAGLPMTAPLSSLQKCNIKVRNLPAAIHSPGQLDSAAIVPHGLLYLEHPYVVPGGRFNEMYGWDSYFIIRGLLRDGRIDLARGMVENFFFEIENYGAVLNANRTYYLSRSQPPFLTSMILAIDQAEKAVGRPDPAWLARAYDYAQRDHALWVSKEHLAGDTGLSRYYDFGEGPVPEGLQDENGYYRGVAEYFLNHPESSKPFLLKVSPSEKNPDAIGPTFSFKVCGDGSVKPGCDAVQTFSLSRSFYKGDRSLRESGFDITFRFEPYGAKTEEYAPVCLNSLLFKTELDLSRLSELLGRAGDSVKWRDIAEKRKSRIERYLWDAQRGQFFDYNFTSKSRSTYAYATTFYPLWAGLATADQARAIVENLRIFEHPGGLAMSKRETGVQWDYPYGWAPIQLLAAEGLRRYGYDREADRISFEFLSMVIENFSHDGTIREKYNVVTRSSETKVTAGYQDNVVGFGWTNGVFVELLQALPPERMRRLPGSASPKK